MGKPLRIAIVGAGTAGLAAACFLARSGHELTVFEQFETARPIGAGLLLQPTGLAVLARLGLDEAAIAGGSVIRHLYGREAQTGCVVFDIGYGELRPGLFGLGIHRGTLFSLLHARVAELGVPITTATRITGLGYRDGLPVLDDAEGRRHGPYDLVIDAHGIRSCIRATHADIRRNRPYGYGALWGICRDDTGDFAGDTLAQRYRHAHHMLGVLPVGQGSVAFFWSLPVASFEAWQTRGLESWKTDVLSLWPEVDGLMAQIVTPSDLTFATYGDLVLKRPFADRIAFIGDSAHCTSPQLGQGGNLALLDAMVLGDCLGMSSDLGEALPAYAAARRRHVAFYQVASRWLTPFFQSDSRTMALIRDHAFHRSARIPYFRRQMLQTLSGVKTGLVTHLDPGKWADAYALTLPERSSSAVPRPAASARRP